MKGTKTSSAFQLYTVRMLGLVGQPCRHFHIGVAIFFSGNFSLLFNWYIGILARAVF